MDNNNNFNNLNNGANDANGYYQPQTPPNNLGPAPTNSNGLATASLILGILSIITSCFVFLDLGLWVSMILAILAIIFGACSKNKTGPFAGKRPGTGLAGLILGIIMLVVDIIILICIVAFVVSVVDGLGNL